ncbi:hypothetical protein IVA80_33330 [Bradyrhizobium sp. 139]|uniref:hypothetical protein n=1 Tax=Bradyrhizobium sp. 139 TaxID=2782616 RepID=UPI001FF7C365|nr:hypothetical protein [Bradyrhizobium sp. 139]MCK1745516.1 hypothetical protein [Bradyrhizobium sp. 139]
MDRNASRVVLARSATCQGMQIKCAGELGDRRRFDVLAAGAPHIKRVDLRCRCGRRERRIEARIGDDFVRYGVPQSD